MCDAKNLEVRDYENVKAYGAILACKFLEARIAPFYYSS